METLFQWIKGQARQKMFYKIAGGGALAVINCTFDLDNGQRAIIFNHIHGVKRQVYSEGSHFIIPWFESPVIFDVLAKSHLLEVTSATRDLQMVNICLGILVRPVADQLPTIYRTFGEKYNERALPFIIIEPLKAVVAQYSASELITQREAVSMEIQKILTERAMNINITLDDVSITSLSFGREFTDAVEAKQVAAQEVERVKFAVEKAEQDKQCAIIRAQGEAKSSIGDNPAFLTPREIEASRVVAPTIA